MNPLLPAILSGAFVFLATLFKLINFGWLTFYLIAFLPVLIVVATVYILLNYRWQKSGKRMPIVAWVSSIIAGLSAMISALVLPDFGDSDDFVWLFRTWPSSAQNLSDTGFWLALAFTVISLISFTVFLIQYRKFFNKKPKNK